MVNINVSCSCWQWVGLLKLIKAYESSLPLKRSKAQAVGKSKTWDKGSSLFNLFAFLFLKWNYTFAPNLFSLTRVAFSHFGECFE